MPSLSAAPAFESVTPGDFLAAMYGDLTEGYLSMFSVDRTTGERHVDWAPVDQLDRLEGAAKARRASSCIWLGMATREKPLPDNRRGGSADCVAIPALWLDIDIAGPNHAAANLPPTMLEAFKVLAMFAMTPSIVVNTGGGLQAYWLLDGELYRTDAQQVLVEWGATWAAIGARLGYHIDNVFDIARVMRLPGTMNRKSTPARLVEVTRWSPERRYSIADIEPYMIEAPISVSRAPQGLRLVPIGNERPGDIYNATADPAQILVEAGFVWDHDTGDGARHFRAPHRAHERGSNGATVWADSHTTIWSDTFAKAHGVSRLASYLPFGLLGMLRYGGDFAKASEAVAAQGYTAQIAIRTPSVPPEGEEGVRGDADGSIVDWLTAWELDSAPSEWLAEPVIALGRAHALYAPGGTGKSLLALWLAVQIATGGVSFDGSRIARRRVLYLDYEMTLADLIERLEDMGYGPTTDLSWLFYALLPSIPPADTPDGGQAILALARKYDAEIVFVDTFARAVAGDENDADTVREWYRWTGMHLKAEGRAFLRVDHAGKDVAKGQRGTSAKNDDVDIVWQMSETDDGYMLTARKRRMSWVPETIAVQKRADPSLHFSTGLPSIKKGTLDLAKRLDELGVDPDASRRAVSTMLRDLGEGAKNDVIGAAIKYRRDRGPLRGPLISAPSGTTTGTTGDNSHKPSSSSGDHAGDHRGPLVAADGGSPPYLYGGPPSRSAPAPFDPFAYDDNEPVI